MFVVEQPGRRRRVTGGTKGVHGFSEIVPGFLCRRLYSPDRRPYSITSPFTLYLSSSRPSSSPVFPHLVRDIGDSVIRRTRYQDWWGPGGDGVHAATRRPPATADRLALALLQCSPL